MHCAIFCLEQNTAYRFVMGCKNEMKALWLKYKIINIVFSITIVLRVNLYYKCKSVHFRRTPCPPFLHTFFLVLFSIFLLLF